MNNLYEITKEAVNYIQERSHFVPTAGIILGTGLGRIADEIEVDYKFSYDDIPHFPKSTVQSHHGNLLLGKLAGVPVAAMQGRLHYYEGYGLHQTTFPVRIMKMLGARYLAILSAAGGLNPLFRAGDIMMITDHINLIGDNPLRGVFDDRLGDRFPDMSRPYDGILIRHAERAGMELKIPLRLGVYAGVSGPSLETRAETRMLRILGADAVGMSTVPEVIVGCQVGFRILAMAAITNVNLPDAMNTVSVEEVIRNAEIAGPKMAEILRFILSRILMET